MSRSKVIESPFRHATLAAVLVACLVPGLQPHAHAQQNVNVTEKDGLLSVQASNTSARSLAEILSTELGISVVVTGDTETLVNIDIVEEPLDKALAKLSPNHMLVRSDNKSDSSIVEVVLMMGEGNSASSGGGDDEFLPSGSPADDIVVTDELPLRDDGAELRDPESSSQTGEAADVDGAPSPDSFDPVTGLPIDPATGQPVQ